MSMNDEEMKAADTAAEAEHESNESIEETVAELKQSRTDTVSEESEEETKDTLKQTAEKTAAAVSESISNLRAKAEETLENNEDLKKTVDYLKANAVKAAEAARSAVDNLNKDPKLQEAGKKAQETLSKAKDTAVEYVKGHINEEKAAEVKAKLEEAGHILNEKTKQAVIKADELYNKPEVQETIGKVRTAAADLAGKAAEALQSLMKKDKSGTDEEESE